MTRHAVLGLAMSLAVAAGGGWWLLRAPSSSVRPGPVRFELVDASGRPWARNTLVRVANMAVGTSTGLTADVTLAQGDWPVVAQPYVPGGCGTFEPYENGRQTLQVSGAPVRAPQTVRLRLGPSLATQLSSQVALRLAAFNASRVVTLNLQWPDGGPAQGVPVRCRDELRLSDEWGEAQCGPTTGQVLAAVGTEAWGGLVNVEHDEDQADLVLAPAMQVRVRLSGAVDEASPVHLTLNAKDLVRDELLTGNDLMLLGLPRSRTIVCASFDERRAPGAGAYGSACEVVLPPDGGVAEAVLALGPAGEVVFQPVDAAGPVEDPVVYLDRSSHGSQPGGTQRFTLSPGRHVLVVNPRSGPERYETVVTVRPGEVTDLGEVRLR